MKRIKLITIEDVMGFMEITNKYGGYIDVKCGSMTLDGRSIVGLFGLGLSRDLDIHMINDDKEECDRFYEEIKRWEV